MWAPVRPSFAPIDSPPPTNLSPPTHTDATGKDLPHLATMCFNVAFLSGSPSMAAYRARSRDSSSVSSAERYGVMRPWARRAGLRLVETVWVCSASSGTGDGAPSCVCYCYGFEKHVLRQDSRSIIPSYF